MLALPEKDREQFQRLEQLKTELKERRYIGETPREQLMFEAVDHIIADNKQKGFLQIHDMKQEAINTVSNLWRNALNKRLLKK
ncbi:hypothetical protein [Kosakonia sacchari]|uniref:hypothetical protein n=1 Tax=Kosakonia sacchari TaxID=1158459 RepID=UPI001584EDD4|nr:hypothetical protein [Kosakonia sacchari]NUL35113.1 hypothetical protein [Kosakonia sacchari]